MSSYDEIVREQHKEQQKEMQPVLYKTGVVPGVGYVSQEKRETYVDSSGTTRHKSGAKMEEVEHIDEAPYQVMGSPDGKKEKKIGKPVKSRKYADARAANFLILIRKLVESSVHNMLKHLILLVRKTVIKNTVRRIVLILIC